MKRIKTKVLCVDDEPRVLEGLALQLRRGYEVHSAHGGPEGLKVLTDEGPFAVVLSDMRMPAMDGATFLGHVREQAPHSVRMLLTGHTDLEGAIKAVNEGQIFRFLTKPCAPDQLRAAFDAAAEQNRLLTAERVLLEETLHGSIKALTDILGITNPLAFGRATRIRKYVGKILDEMKVEHRWQVEVAAMLSQLGSVSLPEEVAEDYYYGRVLTKDHQEMVSRMPQVTKELLASIPRLEGVRAILAGQGTSYGARHAHDEVPAGARILRIATDFDHLECKGLPVQLALDTMRGRRGEYEPRVLKAFLEIMGNGEEGQDVREIPVTGLCVGMAFSEDLRTTTGVLLAARGFVVTASLLERVRNFPEGLVKEPLCVIAPPR